MEQPSVTDVTDVIEKLLKDNGTWATSMTSKFFDSLPDPQEPKVCPAPRRMHALESLYNTI
jgi:uncharacterized protein with gpF-like domain